MKFTAFRCRNASARARFASFSVNASVISESARPMRNAGIAKRACRPEGARFGSSMASALQGPRPAAQKNAAMPMNTTLSAIDSGPHNPRPKTHIATSSPAASRVKAAVDECDRHQHLA